MPSDNSQNPTAPQITPDPGGSAPPPNPGTTPADAHLGVGNAPVQPSEEIPFTSGPPLNDSGPVENQVMANAPMTDDSPPVGIPPAFVPPPKRKMSGGKIVGAILGLLLLVGGIGAGVLLVQQQQDIREKAFSSSGCTAIGGPTAECVPSTYSCSNDYGTVDCGSGFKCGVSCSAPGDSCSGSCFSAAGGCASINRTTANGTCTGGQVCCSTATNPPGGFPGDNCSGSCFNAPGGCASIGQSNASGSCTGGQVCCSNTTGDGSTGGGSCPAGQCWSSDGSCSTPGAYNCISSTQRGFCENGSWVYRDDASCSGNTGGGSGDCRYVNDGNTVSLAGDCSGYTFRALLFECDGSASAGEDGKCEPGKHDGYLSTITDTTGATSVSIGSTPACRSRQADLIVVSRPDSLPGDELPGTPRVANFIIRDGDQSNCGTTVPSTKPSGSPRTGGAQCGAVAAYNTNWQQLNATQLSALKAGDKVRFTITGTRTTGTFTKARFKVNQNPAVEVTSTKPGSPEVFYYEYTIPAGTSSFNVGAAINHSTIGWVPYIIN